ncbi:MAG: HmuY family protein [Spirochaetaceae bacterium]|jgi:hypothetical protein|nr:HmuY family protein [Spirochaetaceae bacterium]
MKCDRIFFPLAILICGTVLFSACPTEVDGHGGLVVEVTPGITRYYSLYTGMEVAPGQKNTTSWDIAFEKEGGRTMLGPRIYTNGGQTATDLGSGGAGAVWYTGKTDFAAVTGADKIDNPAGTEYGEFEADVTKYVKLTYPGGGGNPPQEHTLPANINVMTYLGYKTGSGDGSSAATPYLAKDFTSPATYIPYEFNKKQFYGMNSLTSYYVTHQVYIIRHGDGIHHSKVQIIAFEMPAGRDLYKIVFQNLD